MKISDTLKSKTPVETLVHFLIASAEVCEEFGFE